MFSFLHNRVCTSTRGIYIPTQQSHPNSSNQYAGVTWINAHSDQIIGHVVYTVKNKNMQPIYKDVVRDVKCVRM